MALESGKAGEFERAIDELEKMVLYCEAFKNFTEIDHSSLFVNKIKFSRKDISKHSGETLDHACLRYLNNNDVVFASIKDTPRYVGIKKRLSNL